MQEISVTAFRKSFDVCFDQIEKEDASFMITRYGKPHCVIMKKAEYEKMVGMVNAGSPPASET